MAESETERARSDKTIARSYMRCLVEVFEVLLKASLVSFQFSVSIATSSRAEDVMKEMLALFSVVGYKGGGGTVGGMSRAESAKSGFLTGGKGEADSDDEYME
jgi:hypothetical protein